MKKNNKKGFTIVELVIVIAVIGILAAVLIPTFGSIISNANKSAVEQEARAAFKELYAIDIADGKLEGSNDSEVAAAKNKNTKITTYEASNNNGTETINFVYTDSARGYTVTNNNGTWTTAP